MRQEVLPTAWARLWQGQQVWQAPQHRDKLQQQARGCTLEQVSSSTSRSARKRCSEPWGGCRGTPARLPRLVTSGKVAHLSQTHRAEQENKCTELHKSCNGFFQLWSDILMGCFKWFSSFLCGFHTDYKSELPSYHPPQPGSQQGTACRAGWHGGWHRMACMHLLPLLRGARECVPSRLLLFPQRTFQKSMENVLREAQSAVSSVCVSQPVCGCIRLSPPRDLPGSRDAGQPGTAMSGRETLLNKGK